MEKIRLQKYFSDGGIMSRRAAEAEIAAGHVAINGIPAALGDRADPERDTVTWNGKELPPPRPAACDSHLYLVLNKPAGYVTTMHDEQGRPTATQLLTGLHGRVYPVGRLDMFSDGLLLFTDDGELTNRLTHPSHEVSKLYRLIVKGALTEEDALRLTQPMTLDGYRLRPVEVTLQESGVPVGGTTASVLHVCLHEGRNRQIRRMCEQLGWVVIRLTRLSVGNITLGDLRSGKWRFLTAEEIHELKEI